MYKKWEETGLLRDITCKDKDVENYIKTQVSILLDTQLAENESDSNVTFHRRTSVPAIIRMFSKNNPLWQMISVQSAIDPNESGKAGNQTIDYRCYANIMRTKSINIIDSIEGRTSDLSVEALLTAEVAKSLREDIIRDICRDLRNIAATKSTSSLSADLSDLIKTRFIEMKAIIEAKISRMENYFGDSMPNKFWILGGPEMTTWFLNEETEILLPQKSHLEDLMTEDLTVITDPLYPVNELLVGCFDIKKPTISGYYYFPYSMYRTNENQFHYVIHFKKMIEGGSDFYGRIKFVNAVDLEK